LPHNTPGQPVASVSAVIVPPEKIFVGSENVFVVVVIINGGEPFNV
jgi:hypothetical protein